MSKAKYSCPLCGSLLNKNHDVVQFLSFSNFDNAKKKKRKLHVCSSLSCSYETFFPNHVAFPFLPSFENDFVALERMSDPSEVLDGSFCFLYDTYFTMNSEQRPQNNFFSW